MEIRARETKFSNRPKKKMREVPVKKSGREKSRQIDKLRARNAKRCPRKYHQKGQKRVARALFFFKGKKKKKKTPRSPNAKHLFFSVLQSKIHFVQLSTLTFNCAKAIFQHKTRLFKCFEEQIRFVQVSTLI